MIHSEQVLYRVTSILISSELGVQSSEGTESYISYKSHNSNLFLKNLSLKMKTLPAIDGIIRLINHNVVVVIKRASLILSAKTLLSVINSKVLKAIEPLTAGSAIPIVGIIVVIKNTMQIKTNAFIKGISTPNNLSNK